MALRVKALVEKRESAVKMTRKGFDVQLVSDINGIPVGVSVVESFGTPSLAVRA